MAGRRAARIALSLVVDLAERLDAAGVTADRAPSLEQSVDLVWPLARSLAKLEKSAWLSGGPSLLSSFAAAMTSATRATGCHVSFCDDS